MEYNNPIVNYLIKYKTPIVKTNLFTENPEENIVMFEMNKLGLELIFPFFAEDEMIGILGLGEREGTNLYHDKEIQHLTYLTKALEMHFTSVYFNQNLEELKNISKRFSDFSDRTDFARYIMSSVGRLLNTEHASIYLYNQQTQSFNIEHQFGVNYESINSIGEDNYFLNLSKILIKQFYTESLKTIAS